jgi:hypothetical protein
MCKEEVQELGEGVLGLQVIGVFHYFIIIITLE